jgi:hypothetical protein
MKKVVWGDTNIESLGSNLPTPLISVQFNKDVFNLLRR